VHLVKYKSTAGDTDKMQCFVVSDSQLQMMRGDTVLRQHCQPVRGFRQQGI
jgi:hypothetical protein